MPTNASETMLGDYTPLIRTLHDNALKVSGVLRAYNNVTLYRYSIVETDMKDEVKTLLETITNLTMYTNYPGDISNLSSNTPFIEDVLPLTALFPWYKYDRTILKVDIKDEFEITLKTEFGEVKTKRFEITDRSSTFEEYHLERQFTIAPKRTSTIDLRDQVNNETGSDVPDGIPDDPNLGSIGSNDPTANIIFSDYD